MKFEKPPQSINPDNKEKNTLEVILKKTPQFLSFAAALSASTTAFAQEYEANQVVIIAKESKIKSPEVDRLTKERFGVSIYDSCKRSGCQVLVEKTSQNGKYIIHMGQMHVRPPVDMLVSGAANDVLESQQLIYNTLKDLKNPTVIVEGLAPGMETIVPTNKQEAEKQLVSQEELLMSDSFGVREYQNYLVQKYNINVTYKNFDSYIIPESQENSIRAITEIEVDSIKDSDFREKIISLKASLINNSFYFKGQSDYSYRLPFYKDYDKSVLFALGATQKLKLDSKDMVLLPGETLEINDKANDALELYGADSVEFSKAQNSRDNFAVATAVASGDYLPIIVYGSAHDFGNNLENNNAGDYGIIRIRTNFKEDDIEAEGDELFVYQEIEPPTQERPLKTLSEALGKALK